MIKLIFAGRNRLTMIGLDAPQHAASELRDELCQTLHRDGEVDLKPVEIDLRVSDDGKRLEVTSGHLKAMCDEIEGKLRRIVDQEINAYWRPTVAGEVVPKTAVELAGPSEARKLELEKRAHELFGIKDPRVILGHPLHEARRRSGRKRAPAA